MRPRPERAGLLNKTSVDVEARVFFLEGKKDHELAVFALLSLHGVLLYTPNHPQR